MNITGVIKIKFQYVIWGCPLVSNDESLVKGETILASRLGENYITDLATAENVVKIMEKRGCKNVRIQTIEWTEDCKYQKIF